MGAEMTGFLGYDRYQTPSSDAGNRRNGYSQKELASKVGPIVIDVPRDRKSEFAPAIVKKRHKDIGSFEDNRPTVSLILPTRVTIAGVMEKSGWYWGGVQHRSQRECWRWCFFQKKKGSPISR